MALSNTAVRIIVSVIAIPAIVALCYLGEIYFLIFASVIAFISFYELSLLLKNKGADVSLVSGYSALVLLLANTYAGFTETGNLFYPLVAFILIWELFRNKGSAVYNIGGTMIGVFYVGLFSASLVGIREFFPGTLYEQGGLLIISLLATIWICDSAAFFLGVAFGKHKLFPRVSPKKSWEGAAAGFLFAVLAMIAAKAIILDFLKWQDVIVFGVIVGIFGQIGDLIESLIKRDADVKDSSALIPGHGGIFDRFDSLIYTAPFVFIYLKLFY